MKPLFFWTLGAIAACAQPFSAGVKVGAPFTDVVTAVQNGTSTGITNTDRSA
jgi:hypothetical protein